jgi:hypothetical protein
MIETRQAILFPVKYITHTPFLCSLTSLFRRDPFDLRLAVQAAFGVIIVEGHAEFVNPKIQSVILLR